MSRLQRFHLQRIILQLTIYSGGRMLLFQIMATQHQLSVITNSSVKPPVNPRDGLPNTLHERINSEVYWETAGDEFTDEDEDQQPNVFT